MCDAADAAIVVAASAALGAAAHADLGAAALRALRAADPTASRASLTAAAGALLAIFNQECWVCLEDRPTYTRGVLVAPSGSPLPAGAMVAPTHLGVSARYDWSPLPSGHVVMLKSVTELEAKAMSQGDILTLPLPDFSRADVFMGWMLKDGGEAESEIRNIRALHSGMTRAPGVPLKATLNSETGGDAVGTAGGEGTEDVRTLWIDYDEHGERFKPWREVCKESYLPNLTDRESQGPITTLNLIKHWLKNGGDPRLWFQNFCHNK